jgi:hypothetical protein
MNIFIQNIPITIKNLEIYHDFAVDLSNLPVGLEKLKIWHWNKNNFINIKIPFGCQVVDNDNVRILQCSHIFHTDCIDNWLTEHSHKCPCCRKETASHNPKF